MSSKLAIDPNAIYSRGEAAHLLGLSLSTLKHLVRTGQLVVSHPQGIRRVFIKGSSIFAMLDRTMLIPDGFSSETFGNSFLNQQFALGSKYSVPTAYMKQAAAAPETHWNRNGQSNAKTLRDKRITHARRPAIAANRRGGVH